MIAAGLTFDADDNITLSVAGTQLPTSMTTLHALNADEVYFSETDETIPVNVDYGPSFGMLSAFSSFDLESIDGAFGPEGGVGAADDGLAQLFGTEIPLPESEETFGKLVQLLSNAAVEDLENSSGNLVAVEDALAAALAEAGMLEILPAVELQLDATRSGQFVDTTLTAMAGLGVDRVYVADYGETPVYVDLGVDSASATGDALLQLFNALDSDHDASAPLFVGATNVSLVVDQTTADLLKDTAGALQALSDLGFTEIAIVGAADGYAQFFGPAPVAVKLIGQDEDPFHHFDQVTGKI